MVPLRSSALSCASLSFLPMFLGIDQSLRSTGVALVDPGGAHVYTSTVKPGNLKGVERLHFIRNALHHLVVGKTIFSAAIEGYSLGSVNRSFDLGELGGIVRLFLYDAKIPFVIVPPTSLKLFVSSNGSSDKEAMRKAVFKKWGIDLAQDDECDAFGLAKLARAYLLNTGQTRAELEVIKKLRGPTKKLSLTAPKYPGISI